MECADVIKLLDPNNPRCEELSIAIGFIFKDGSGAVERKDKNLLDVVRNMIDRGYYPIVDKKLQLVFGVESGFHMMIREQLYAYHMMLGRRDCRAAPSWCADRYTDEGLGWHISSVNLDHIVLGQRYRPDKFDKEVFPFFQTSN